jgi:large subunit ribosomal protein L16
MNSRKMAAGSWSTLAVCMIVVAVRIGLPIACFVTVPPGGSSVGKHTELRAASLVVKNTSGLTAGQRSDATNVMAGAALCAAAGLFVFASRKSVPCERSSKRQAVALQACLQTESVASLPQAGFSFAGSSSPLLQSRSPSLTTRHLLMPKNIKWKKPQKPVVKPFGFCNKWKYRGHAYKGNKPHFGKHALQVLEEAWVTAELIEYCRRMIVQTMQRKGKMWIRVFPHSAITKRSAESRMGAGKGTIDHWVAAVRPGFILFEMDAVPDDVGERAMTLCVNYLQFKTRYIVKNDGPSMFELGLAGSVTKKSSIPKQFRKDTP